jgi:hypothetical protein
MTNPRKLRPAFFGEEVSHVYNSAGHALFKHVKINWSKQRIWKRDEAAPDGLAEVRPPYVYALTRDHGRSLHKPQIVYVGLSTNRLRFYNHPKAKKIRNMNGRTLISIGVPEFEKHHHKKGKKGTRAIDEIEHILIWAVSPKFNERKMFTMPGMGKHPGRAWHIENIGKERFSGKLPREIVYPWMLIKPGRDRSKKKMTR